MFKKIVMTSVITMSCSALIAQAAPYVGTSLGVNINTSTTDSSPFRGMPLNFFAGYGANVNQTFYLAGEAFVTPATAPIYNTSSTTRTTYSYGASFIPGILLSENTLGYARVGMVRTHFKTADESEFGAELGFGMQASITQKLDLRGEYIFIAYNSTNQINSPKMDQFNVGLVYKFE